ncbi:MAG: hypothetical protein KGO81_05415 [Bacteroidota bacterium]|nr:hypothetical protein [Bacteroidota bacterium]
MKFIIATFLTALLSYAIGLFMNLPWWSFVVCSFVVALAIHQKPFKAFGAGFVALFVLWGVLAFMIDSANDHILSRKVAQILPLGGSAAMLIMLTAFLGGLLAGLAALAGSFIRKS